MALHQKTKAILLNHETPATVLLVIAADLLGPEFLQWDPEAIRMELDEALGTKLPEYSLNRLMAAIELVTSDVFYRDLPTFNRLCVALFHGILIVETFEPADAIDIAWGITEAMLIWPPDPKDESPFSEDIIAYIAAEMKNEGIMMPPDVLRLGGGDGKLWEKVQMDFSDDPGMFASIYAIERARTDEINALVKAKLRNVLDLLNELPLNTGDTKGAVERMFGALKQTEQKGSELKPAV